ncbi:hypothetical protein QYM36_005881 [Artemia franciscana]|uniref:Glucosidase 2 subunit beta n=1 Tax=Artemia franciscana TaxID=6661 RepID=A0AA88HZR1_ARTSF|nr:hypothetical protein QYM36_005881 [Artemia franciscana]
MYGIDGVDLGIDGIVMFCATLYDPSHDFTCLDGSEKIPFSYINDDYCDCKDGSDEPGTSACPNGMFFCRNIGYRSHYIPSSRVNDGICDCCDGSDEWATGTNCTNNCYELGASAREEAKEKHDIQQRGYQLKLQYSEQGKQSRKEKQEKFEILQRERSEIEAVKLEREALKEAAEIPEKEALEKHRAMEEEIRSQRQASEKQKRDEEALAAFEQLDSNQDGVLTSDEIMAKPIFDQNGDGLVSEEEAKFFLSGQTEMTREEFLNTGFVLMKPYLTHEEEVASPPPSSTVTPPAEGGELPEIPEGETDEEEEDFDHGEADHDDRTEDSEVLPVEETLPYDPETQKIVDEAKAARDAYNEADRRLREIERDLKNIEDSMKNDYGPEEEFSPLHGHCFEFTDREYTYKFCPFDYASQRPKHGGSETRLGQWGHWAGPENNKYSIMMLEKGVQCWNGPQRSCKVHFTCGVDNVIMSASEPNRCEYEMNFVTPTACAPPTGSPDDLLAHDEL